MLIFTILDQLIWDLALSKSDNVRHETLEPRRLSLPAQLPRARAWLARGYFIPGGMSQRGAWSGSGVPCRTLSDTVTC